MKQQLNKKLTLSRETIRALTDTELNRAVGGQITDTINIRCRVESITCNLSCGGTCVGCPSAVTCNFSQCTPEFCKPPVQE